MSLPASMAPAAFSSMMAVSPLDSLLQVFNSNPYFIGIMMLVLNLGGRFISLEVTKKQEQFLQHPWIRRILIFTVLFVATRNIWVAFWTTVTVVLFLGYLFNENSSLCLFGSGGIGGSKCADEPKPGEEMTPEEKEILQRLSAKAQRYQAGSGGAGGANSRNKNPTQTALEKSLKFVKTSPNLKDSGEPADEEDDVLHTDIYAANLTLLKN
jgi:hypothetical protein